MVAFVPASPKALLQGWFRNLLFGHGLRYSHVVLPGCSSFGSFHILTVNRKSKNTENTCICKNMNLGKRESPEFGIMKKCFLCFSFIKLIRLQLYYVNYWNRPSKYFSFLKNQFCSILLLNNDNILILITRSKAVFERQARSRL